MGACCSSLLPEFLGSARPKRRSSTGPPTEDSNSSSNPGSGSGSGSTSTPSSDSAPSSHEPPPDRLFNLLHHGLAADGLQMFWEALDLADAETLQCLNARWAASGEIASVFATGRHEYLQQCAGRSALTGCCGRARHRRCNSRGNPARLAACRAHRTLRPWERPPIACAFHSYGVGDAQGRWWRPFCASCTDQMNGYSFVETAAAKVRRLYKLTQADVPGDRRSWTPFDVALQRSRKRRAEAERARRGSLCAPEKRVWAPGGGAATGKKG